MAFAVEGADMRRTGWLAVAFLVGAFLSAPASSARAQGHDPRLPAPRTLAPAQADETARMSLGELTPTPQMWLYEQERRRYEDPRNAGRAHAEFKGAQRRQRIAAMQWFGFSNARPNRSATPTLNPSSPHWGGNNSHDPSLWSGVGRPTIVLGPETTYVR
jgi:hypothetical protein